MVKRLVAIILIFGATSVGWLALGVLTESRTRSSYTELGGAVGELWGMPHCQAAPEVFALAPATAAGDGEALSERVPVPLTSTDATVRLDLDYRRKGLLWFSTYNVSFFGTWTAVNTAPEPRRMVAVFRFPSSEALYDGFSLTLNGVEVPARYSPEEGGLEGEVTVDPGATLVLSAAYRSRGLDRWIYRLGPEVAQVRDFTLVVETDFKDVDFPPRTLSPTSKEETPTGWRLTWQHENLISGFEVGVEMPHRLNPGPLAAKVSFFAPVCLLFFFFVIFVLSVLRNVNLHPMHYFFLAAAFFSFHLLFAYLVDHIDLHLAFAIAAATSVALVVSYLRVVVGPRFAFVEAGLAQLVYLVLFSYTQFLEGFTGLAVTVASVLTLFVLMQATARVDWEKVFAGQGPAVPGRPSPEKPPVEPGKGLTA